MALCARDGLRRRGAGRRSTSSAALRHAAQRLRGLLPGLFARRSTAETNVVRIRQLGRVFEALREQGIEVILLPGAALPDLGFRHPDRHLDLAERDRLMLYLHDDVVNSGRVTLCRFGGGMVAGSFWGDRCEVEAEGGETAVHGSPRHGVIHQPARSAPRL